MSTEDDQAFEGPSAEDLGMTGIAQLHFPPANIAFVIDGKEIMRFEEGGKAYVYGELVDNNKEIYKQLQWFLGSNTICMQYLGPKRSPSET